MSTTANKMRREKKPVEVIVFEDPEKRRKSTTSVKESVSSSKPAVPIERPVFDQRMARFDIRKLAMTGMKEEDKDEAMVNYLVELGAKRPKNKPIPMKDYIEELKKRKLEGDSNLEEGGGRKIGKGKRIKRDKNDIFIDGQIGKWKRGVQFINTGKKYHKRM